MEKDIIVSASFNKQKYYFNNNFIALPTKVQNELKTVCIYAAEKIKGIFSIGIYDNGSISFEAMSEENDIDFDEINAKYIVNQIEDQKKDLIHSLSMWFVFNKELEKNKNQI